MNSPNIAHVLAPNTAWLGILFEVLATSLGTVGKQLVSCSARLDPRSKRKRHLKVAGLFTTTIPGPVLDSLAYAFAPQMIIAPLNGLDIVWNTCSAPFTLGERLKRRHVAGTVLVFLGASSSAAVGPHTERAKTLANMQSTFICWRFLAYAAVFLSLLAVCFIVLARRPKGVGDPIRGALLGLMAGGIAGNMYFTSAALGLLTQSISSGDWSPWAHWLPYLVAVGAALVAVGNIPLMMKGLQEYEALFMVTLFEGCHITVACISGHAVLRELDMLSWPRYSAYCFCVLLILFGLAIIQTSARGIQTQKLTGDKDDGDSNSSVTLEDVDSDRSVADSSNASAAEKESSETTTNAV